MAALFLFGAISLTWGVMGLILTVAPTTWIAFAKKVLHDPWQRFWMAQGMLVIGLVLIIGTPTLQGYWLWVGCGVVVVVKACILLGSTEAFRDRWTTLATTRPTWVYRSGGILSLVIAVCLAADTILHG